MSFGFYILALQCFSRIFGEVVYRLRIFVSLRFYMLLLRGRVLHYRKKCYFRGDFPFNLVIVLYMFRL